MNRGFIASLASCALVGLSIGCAHVAQQANTATTQPAFERLGVGSQPQVHADRTVLFRISAPNAQKVTLSGDMTTLSGPIPLVKDSKGTWSVTVGPLRPDYYGYNYTIDGVDMPDPNNTNPKVGVIWFASQVLVPGPEADYLTHQNVPHGQLHNVWYHSDALGADRRVVVYTPPGYEQSPDKSYPVLYLLHGHGDDETGWTNAGLADTITDNLIAAGKARPMLIVMPFGTTTRQALVDEVIRARTEAPRRNNPPTTQSRTLTPETAAIQKELLDNVIPLVEKSYRIQKDRASRAIAGLSMGGQQTLVIGLNHLELFSHVAAFSAGLNNNPGPYDSILDHADTANQQLRLFYIGVGDKDRLMIPNEQFEQALTKAGVKHQWELAKDYGHQWSLWRMELRDVLPQLFQ